MKELNPCYSCEHRDQLCDHCRFSEEGKILKGEIEKNLSKHFA